MKISARNHIPARVTSITTGQAIGNVELDAGGTRLIVAGLRIGREAVWRYARNEYLYRFDDACSEHR